MKSSSFLALVFSLWCLQPPAAASAQQLGATAAVAVQPPSDYVIGPEDVLGVLFWRDEAMTSDVLVRPDGMISLPLLNDVKAAGRTPEQLRADVLERSRQFLEAPNVSVVVRQINSRKAYITGQVTRPGPYPLGASTTVLQFIALAGGFTEFTDGKNVTILRPGPNDKTEVIRFNFDEVRKGKNLHQNILLKTGDTVVVP